MKDYITKLTERALGVQPLARPVIPSLYAQGPVMIADSMANESADDSERREFNAFADDPRLAHRRREDTAETIARSSRRNDDSSLQDGLPVRDVTGSSVDASEARPARPRDVRATVKPDQVGDLPVTTRLASDASTIRPRAPEINATHHESASTRLRAEQRAIEPSGESRQLHGDQSRHTPADQSATQRRRPVTTHVRPAVAEPVTPPLITTQARQRLASSNDLRANPESPALPPTIRITIGRVEVRALVSPAPQAKPRATHTPKLSLDDYLRTRNGGNR